MLPNANKKKQVHPRKIAPVRAPSNTTAIPHKVAQARKRTALDDVSNVSNASDVNNVNNVSTQIKPSGRNENIIQPPIKPLMGNENIMQQQGKPSYRNENIIQPKVKPSMGNVNIMPPQVRTAMGNENITKPQVMPLMGNVNIMPPQARLAMGNENIVPSQQVKPAVSMVTRKRALLMDRTNFSFKPTTVTEKAHDNIKPIIKNENSNLIFPPVEFNNISELDRKRSKKQRIQEWEDLDADDLYDPMTVSEYAVDIFKYLKELEIETMPKPDYMLSQTELTWRMRGILVDWLIEVHHKFRLLPETLFLAVNIIDRFLSVRVVSLVKLQLVGITGLFIAAKYEEVLAPSVKNFIYMADNGYTEAEILKAERYVLTIIDFKLCYPNPMNFLRRASKADDFDIQARTVAKYLMEISLVDYKFLSSPPSMIAAVSLYLARKMLNRTEWHANLIHYSMYTEDELRNCENLILQYLIKPIKYEQLFKKYATKRFMKASIFVKNWIAKNIKIN